MRLSGLSFSRIFAGLSLMILAATVILGFSGTSAHAVGQLTLTVQKGLSLVDESEAVTVQGAPGTLTPGTAAEVVIRVLGPVPSAQVGSEASALPGTASVRQPVATEEVMADGSFTSRVVVSLDLALPPGAYLAVAELVWDGQVQASGEHWLGKAAPQMSVDVACVWPLTLGIHRDADGVFFDDVLERSVEGAAEASGPIAGLAAVAEKYPDWRFTLGVEPVSLAQLYDMSDGYVRRSGADVQVEAAAEEVAAGQGPAGDAAAALQSLRSLATSEGREVAVTPYAGPSMEFLSAAGWRDGLEQVQLGKQVAQQVLGVSGTIMGAYASDLDVTTDSLGSYGMAFIDHLLVSSTVAAGLEQPLSPGTVAARVRDEANQRVTLVFADEDMQAAMSPPWDIGLFYAGLAAELASEGTRALVLTPRPGTDLPPVSYVEAVGALLQRLEWVRTRTLSDLVRAQATGLRPVHLDREATAERRYIAQEIRGHIEAAHEVVTDLAEAAGTGRSPVETAQALLYVAESRWWGMPNVSPWVANIGLRYAQLAQARAEAELSKITTEGFRSGMVSGREGTVSLVVRNGTTYPVKADLHLTAEGLTLPQGENRRVELPPGTTEIPITVAKDGGRTHLQAGLTAGNQGLGEASTTVHFVTPGVILLWVTAAVIAVALVAYGALIVIRSRRQKSRARA